MPVKPVPDGHHTVTPYLIVEDVPGLIDFLAAAFGAEPTMPPMRDPDGAIMHAEVRIGDSRVMMGQACPQQPARPAMLHLYVSEVDRLHQAALAAGATSVREVADQFYGDRTGGVRDRWGNEWWIATHTEDVSLEELQRRMAAMAPAG